MIPTKLIFRDGFLWEVPKTDELCFDAIYTDSACIQRVIQYCSRHRVAVQAGGNVGVYPLKLIENFKRVLTFEPAQDNFQCLKANIEKFGTKADGVFAFQAALADSVCGAQLQLVEPTNCGTYRTTADASLPHVPTIVLDHFHLGECDLIWLDIEGFEHVALHGALETIKRCRPVIVLEVKDHCENYGRTREQVCQWVMEQGYFKADEAKDDLIFVPKERQV